MGSQLKRSWWPTEDGRNQRPIEGGRGGTLHLQSGGRKEQMLVLSSFFPFSTAQDPSLVMVLPFHVTLPQHRPEACPEGCLHVPSRARAYSGAEELLALSVLLMPRPDSFALCTQPKKTWPHNAACCHVALLSVGARLESQLLLFSALLWTQFLDSLAHMCF